MQPATLEDISLALTNERNLRAAAEAKLAAQRAVCMQLQQSNEVLAAELALVKQRLQATARQRNELRSQLEKLAKLESATSDVIGRRMDTATYELTCSLRSHIHRLEGELKYYADISAPSECPGDGVYSNSSKPLQLAKTASTRRSSTSSGRLR